MYDQQIIAIINAYLNKLFQMLKHYNSQPNLEGDDEFIKENIEQIIKTYIPIMNHLQINSNKENTMKIQKIQEQQLSFYFQILNLITENIESEMINKKYEQIVEQMINLINKSFQL